MNNFVRRIVTGHDENGKAVVLSDGYTPVIKTDPLRPGYRGTDVWKTFAMPAPISSTEVDPTLGPRPLLPAPNGTTIRITDLAPETKELTNLSPEKIKTVFQGSSAPSASTYKEGARHPLMHRTETIDYAVVLEGEITLILDDKDVILKAGDVVVQRGNNHSWSNRSDKVCRMLYVLIDGQFDPELKKMLDSQSAH